jgi:hypothetical protein
MKILIGVEHLSMSEAEFLCCPTLYRHWCPVPTQHLKCGQCKVILDCKDFLRKKECKIISLIIYFDNMLK